MPRPVIFIFPLQGPTGAPATLFADHAVRVDACTACRERIRATECHEGRAQGVHRQRPSRSTRPFGFAFWLRVFWRSACLQSYRPHRGEPEQRNCRSRALRVTGCPASCLGGFFRSIFPGSGCRQCTRVRSTLPYLPRPVTTAMCRISQARTLPPGASILCFSCPRPLRSTTSCS